MSKHIKEKFDEKYGTNWHCVVGKNFASYCSYEAKNYIFFYEGQLAVLLYKIGWSFLAYFLSLNVKASFLFILSINFNEPKVFLSCLLEKSWNMRRLVKVDKRCDKIKI